MAVHNSSFIIHNSPCCLTIAGSDSGGNAGVQADLRAFHAYSLHGCTVFAALTAQNPREVSAIHPVPADFVKAQLDAATQEVNVAKNDVQTKQGNVRIAQEEVKTADTALANARADYQKTVHGVAEGYRQEYQTAIDRLSNPPEGTTKAELEANVQSARANLEMAYAAEADMLATDGVMTAAQRQDLLASARANVDATMDSAYRRMDVKALDRKLSTLQGIGNINQAIGGVLQSMTQNLNTVYASDATRQGAETAKQEEMLDQTKDLFSQEQKVIDQVIQLCQAVIQAESQSMRDAIQA